MSNRTSVANKAIREAWRHEKALVQNGYGTRDWTPKQQVDILTKGKAYDVRGRAFEGHHMKSAEVHPESQGNSWNIQFLSRKEHFEAHNRNFKQSTDGVYDTISGKTRLFNHIESPLAEPKKLSYSIIENNNKLPIENRKNSNEQKKESKFSKNNLRDIGTDNLGSKQWIFNKRGTNYSNNKIGVKSINEKIRIFDSKDTNYVDRNAKKEIFISKNGHYLNNNNSERSSIAKANRSNKNNGTQATQIGRGKRH